MREIIFRGKRVDNGEWVYGELIKTTTGWMITNYDSIDMNSSLANSRYLGDIAAIKINPETVGQFTGLTDKNGNKIFEGDICQIMRIRKYGYDKDNDPLIVGHIKFGRISVNGNDLSVYNAFHINGRSIEYLIGQELEVIGNIHESLTPNK